ncbi:hypothetical protein EJW82_22740 [Escherichia coli]|uniref:Uncharacterized protein n=1 Tax=Escherichia coli TaxID=562 RepID=A0A3P1I4R6_ECOLX|nr:hypothetical protein [Escherichia coli]ECC3228947.1 hypothetical protein [Salmonella enterica subsp. enterica]EFN8657891.1 hypothetical protein [Escherichia coli O2]EEV5907925.1 hypothetical protein [Escherichia coli]EEV5962959.1 hypothetical protein [Escherichia coli]
MTDFGGKTCIFSHPVYLFLREFSLQDFRGGLTFITTPTIQNGRRGINPYQFNIISFDMNNAVYLFVAL